MRNYACYVVVFVGLVLTALQISAADTNGMKFYKFRAETLKSRVSTTDVLQGEYAVSVSGGKCEVTQGDYSISGNSAAELCRMVRIDPDLRRYLPPPEFKLKTGATWRQRYCFKLLGGGQTFCRTTFYKVVGEERITDNEVLAFNIEGAATTFYPSGQIPQVWEYSFSPILGVITKFFYESAPGGATVSINLIESK